MLIQPVNYGTAGPVRRMPPPRNQSPALHVAIHAALQRLQRLKAIPGHGDHVTAQTTVHGRSPKRYEEASQTKVAEWRCHNHVPTAT